MPKFENESDVVDPDDVRRPIMAVAVDLETGSMAVKTHQHRKAQLIYATRGALKCEVEQGLWVVPPQCAVWIPGRMPHSVEGAGPVDLFCLFVDPKSAPNMPKDCCTVSVSDLLSELILRCSKLPALYPLRGAESRMVTVLLDELEAAPVEKLHLPMPKDSRLRRIVTALTADPSDRAAVQEWGKRVGLGERTLSRLVLRETGMSFGRWRQQLHIILALQWLSQGASVQSVANDLGYENASSFVVMFRKTLGTSPARYMRKRLSDVSEV